MMNFIDYSYLYIYTLLPSGKRFNGLYVFLCTTIWIVLLLFPLAAFIGFYYTINSFQGDIAPFLQSPIYKNFLKLSLAVLLVVYDVMTNKAFEYKDISRQELKAKESVKYTMILWLITDIILFVPICYYLIF